MGKDLKGKELGMGLSQRKDGRYQARFTSRTKERIEKNFTKISQAKSWLRDEKYLDDVSHAGNMTVDDWYNVWIQNYKEGVVRDNTSKNYKLRYQLNIKQEIGYMKLRDVRQLDCQKVINHMCDTNKYKLGTIKLTKVTLHALFKGAVDNEYLSKNPAVALKIKERSGEREERRVLTREEQEVFKEYAGKTLYKNAYCLVLETGLRCGEVSGLQWQDVDFDNKYIYVRHTLLQNTEKGGFYLGDPKTRESRRKIPLTNEAINILKDQEVLQKKLKLKSTHWNKEWNSLVFTTTNGSPVGHSTFRNLMVRIVNNINFDRKCSSDDGDYEEFEHCYMHSLRHTFATRCIENGIQPKTLQKILGHSSINITMDLYVHVTDEQMFREIEKMN